LFSRVLRAGETWPVPARPDLVLTTGNAGGTVLVVDGVASAPLGASGAVRRDLPLDLDEVKAGRLAATPALR
jgi:cytoskeleton protein RodZ